MWFKRRNRRRKGVRSQHLHCQFLLFYSKLWDATLFLLSVWGEPVRRFLIIGKAKKKRNFHYTHCGVALGSFFYSLVTGGRERWFSRTQKCSIFFCLTVKIVVNIVTKAKDVTKFIVFTIRGQLQRNFHPRSASAGGSAGRRGGHFRWHLEGIDHHLLTF